MSKYGDVAVLAAALAQSGEAPRTAWETAATKVFPKHSASRTKVCPRTAFLALIDADMVMRVRPSGAAHKLANGTYATRAVEVLRARPDLVGVPSQLWAQTPGASKQHNGQMHVVIALWQQGYLRGAG